MNVIFSNLVKILEITNHNYELLIISGHIRMWSYDTLEEIKKIWQNKNTINNRIYGNWWEHGDRISHKILKMWTKRRERVWKTPEMFQELHAVISLTVLIGLIRAAAAAPATTTTTISSSIS